MHLAAIARWRSEKCIKEKFIDAILFWIKEDDRTRSYTAHQLAKEFDLNLRSVQHWLKEGTLKGAFSRLTDHNRARRKAAVYVLGPDAPLWSNFEKGEFGLFRTQGLAHSLVLKELERVPYPDQVDSEGHTEPPTTLQPTPPAEPRVDEIVKIANKEEKKKEPAPKPAATKPAPKPKQQPLSQEARDLSQLIIENGTSRPGAFGAVKLAETQGRIQEAIKAVHLAIPWLPKSNIKNHGAYLQKLVANPENIKLFYRYLDKPKKKILLADKVSEALAKREEEEKIRLQDPLERYAKLIGVRLTWENRDEIELDLKKSLERFHLMEQENLRKTEAKRLESGRGE